MDDNQKVFKLCSVLLQYPDQDWLNINLLKKEIADLENTEIQEQLRHFLYYLESKSLPELCEEYVTTFDFNEKTTLYLTYPIFGDNRERGPALLELKGMFEEGGYIIVDDELPDYFPLILEFCAFTSKQQNEKLFKAQRKSIEALLQGLEKLSSPYFSLIAACTLAINDFMRETKAS